MFTYSNPVLALLLQVLSGVSTRDLFMLVITVLSLGALGCFAAALYFWAVQGGHQRLAARLERKRPR